MEGAVLILSVSHTRPTREWLDRFSDRLMQLMPGLSAVAANRQAQSAHPLASTAEPEKAAEEFVASRQEAGDGPAGTRRE
jgi:hypothetical protein